MLLPPPRWRIGETVAGVVPGTGRRVTGELLCYREPDAWALVRLQRPEGARRPIVRVSLVGGRRGMAVPRAGHTDVGVSSAAVHAHHDRSVECQEHGR